MSAQRPDRSPDRVLDRLAELAREQEPPALDESSEAALVRNAMRRAECGAPRRSRSRALIAVAAAAVLVPATLGVVLMLRSGGEQQSPALLRASLPTGDQLVATAGAQFEVESATDDSRQVSVSRGAVLFEVEPLADDQQFRVVTEHLAVEVRGTVFSVETENNQSVVRVYEGHVEVLQGSTRHGLRARQMWASNGRSVRPVDEGPLSDAGEEAARRREAVAIAGGNEAQEDAMPAPTPSPGFEEQAVATDVSIEETTTDTQPPHQRPESESRPPPAEAAETSRPEGHEIPQATFSTVADTRRMLLRGEAERALAVARANSGADWRMLEADALRTLRRFQEAAAAYDRVATELQGPRASQAGYLAAYVRSRHLGDSSGALASLDRSGADRPGSPLAERALALRARTLQGAGRTDEARGVAAEYLQRYPDGGMSEWMRALLGIDSSD